MGAGSDGGEIGLGPIPTVEGVANGVDSDGEARVLGESFEPGPGAKVVLGEDHTGDGSAFSRLLDRGEGGEGFELRKQTRLVNLDVHDVSRWGQCSH
jgi:hypothetical protein